MTRLTKPTAQNLERDGLALAARLMDQICNAPVPVVSAGDFAAAIIQAFAHGQAVVFNRAAGRRTCRVCGCWELAACDEGCSWIEADLCSSCPSGAALPTFAQEH